MSYILVGKYVYTDFAAGEAGLLRSGAVYIDGDTIRAVGEPETLRRAHPEAEVVGGEGFALLPGLIDAHSHGSGLSHVQRGVGFDYLENSLCDWSRCIVLPPELNAPLTALRHLRNGCTAMHHNVMGTVCDASAYETSARYLRAYRQAGLRVAHSPGIRDVNALASGDEAFYETLPEELRDFARPQIFFDKARARQMYLEWFEGLYRDFNSDMSRIFLGPCWAHGATDELLLQVKQAAEDHGHIPIHIHTLQTPIQRGYGLRRYGKSLLKRLDELGVAADNLTLGHAVYLDEEDIEILRDRGASVTHHASCNLAMRNGIAPAWHLQRAGVNVALGIDEKGINDDEDPFMELRMIAYLSRLSGFDLERNQALTPWEVFAMGTRNAARSLGLAGLVGALLPGMRADAVLLDLREVEENPCLVPGADPAGTMLHRALGRFVTDVFVDGVRVVADRRCTTIDAEALYAEVRDFAARGQTEAQRRYAESMGRLKPYLQAWYRGMDDFPREPYYLVNSRR